MTTLGAAAGTDVAPSRHVEGPAAPAPLVPTQATRSRGAALVVATIVAGYVVLVLLGVTTSSLGFATMRQDPAHPHGATLGIPRSIRSDEFSVETPLLLGLAATGSDSAGFPLSAPADVLSGVPTSGGSFSAVVFFDGTLMRLGGVLPIGSLFAAHWWLPWLLLLLALPPWLRRVGATAPMSWFATALVVTAPATAWWSAFPLRILAFAVAGCLLAMTAATAFGRRRWLVGSVEAALAGLLLARLATWYIPWSVTLGAPVLLATACWLLVDRERRRSGLLALSATALVSLVLVGGLYAENWPGVKAAMDTVYPGERRSSGVTQPLAMIFGAPGDGYFQWGHGLTASNLSEMSAGFTFCAAWAAILFMTGPQALARFRRGVRVGEPAPRRADTWVLRVLAAATAVELAWCTVDFGHVGTLIPVLNRVPPERAAQTVGFVAVLTVSLMLSRRGRATGWRVPLLAALGSAALTAVAVAQLRSYSPTMPVWLIGASTVGVFAVVLAITRRPDRWVWTVAAACLAGLGVAAVNPLQFGVGDTRASASAHTMLAEGVTARADGTFWATDGADTDTLLVATGVPTLSGLQIAGPDKAAWTRLDPSGAYEGNWNRGGASVEATWLAAGPPVITVGAPDQIKVAADPCDLVARGFPLSHVISSSPLHNSCLRPAGELQWAGTTRYIYRTR